MAKTNNIQIEFLEFLRENGKVFNSAFEIGCHEGHFLFSLEEFDFTKLFGIDLLSMNWEDNYVQIMFNHYNKKGIFRLPKELKNTFQEKYKISSLDYKNYPFQIYSCIICKNVIHLLPYEEQFPLIDKIYNHLEPSGIALFVINTYEGQKAQSPENFKEISPGILQGSQIDKTMYLRSNSELNEEILKYNWTISKSLKLDSGAVCLFLKK